MIVKPEDACLGMYVCGFEGNWLSHPFWRANFIVTTQDELVKIRHSRASIVIDPARGVTPVIAGDQTPEGRKDIVAIGPKTSSRWHDISSVPTKPLPPRPAPRRIVPPAAFGKADKARAAALAQRSTKVVKALFEDCRLGREIAAPQIIGVVRDIADTLEQNSAAFASVTRLKAKDDGTYTHSVAVCALLISLAREIGASPEAVQDYGIAGLLHDIGKLQIDDAVLQKVGPLTDAERAHIALHPELGHAILSAETGLPAVALDICLHHHERVDGSGYPFGLSGDQITPAARMAAICDVYDAMTSDRPYKKGMSPIDAITEMAGLDGHFDQDLLFRFMRSIAVFPPGKLLRLRSNRLAIVLPSAHADRLPVVRAFYATVGSHFVDYEDVILSDRLSDDQAVSQEDPAVWFSDNGRAMAARIIGNLPVQTPPSSHAPTLHAAR